jgi:hypothetical protein
MIDPRFYLHLFLFTGKGFDGETELYLCPVRHYAPGIGVD